MKLKLEKGMSSEEETRADTLFAFSVFKSIPEHELCELLWLAGIVPADTAQNRVKQAMINWFHGSVPNHQTLDAII